MAIHELTICVILSTDQDGLILCVSEGFLSELLCIHNVGMGTFDIHELTLCVSEGVLSRLPCIHNVGMGTFGPHGLILYVMVGFSFQLL